MAEAKSTKPRKRDKIERDRLEEAQAWYLLINVGDYVSDKLVKQHVPCRVVQAVGKIYRLCCYKGVLKDSYTSSELMTLSSDCSISLDNWRIVSLREVTEDPTSLEACDCILDKSTTGITDLTDLTGDPDVVSTRSNTWLCNPLYTLTCNNREEILSPDEWLSDSVIDTSQKLVLQQFPHMSAQTIICADYQCSKHSLVFVSTCMTACTLPFPHPQSA